MSAQRDVIYTLRVEYDETASRQAIARMTSETAKAEKASTTEHDKAAKEKEKQDQRVFTNRMKLLDRIAKEQRKKEADELAAAEKLAKEKQKQEETVFKNRMRLLDRIAKEKRRKDAEELAETKRMIATAERMQQASMQKIEALGEKLKGSIAQGAEGFMKMARGAAILGVSGEKDLQKLLEALAKIQAAFDIARGAMEVYFALAAGVKAYRDAVIAAKIAEDALAIARARSAAAGGAAGAGGAAAGGAGSLIGGLAGTAGLAAGGGLALAGGAAAFGVGAAGYSAYQFARDDNTAEPGMFARAAAFGVNYANPIGLIGNAATGGRVGSRVNELFTQSGARQRAEEQGAQALSREAARAANEVRKLGEAAANSSIMQNRISGMLGMAALPGGDRLGAIAQAQSMVGSRLGAIGAEVGSGQTMSTERMQSLLDEQAALAQQQVDLSTERLRIEQEIADTKRREAMASLSAMESELDLVNRIAQVEAERLMSAQERFGQLDEAEQKRILAVRRRAEEVGAANLTREERATLRGVGLESTTRIAREGDLAAAEAAGFGELVTAEDRATGEAARARAAELQVSIEDQRKIIVEIDADAERVQQQIIAQIREEYARQQEAFESSLRFAARTALEQARNEQAQRANAADQARR